MSAACPRCTTELSANARFCAECGEALIAATASTNRVTRVASPSLLAQHPRPRTATGAASALAASSGATMTGPRTVSGGGGVSGQRERMVLLIDTSGSMAGPFEGGTSKLDAAVRAGRNLIANKALIDPHDEIGIVSFTEKGLVQSLPVACGTRKDSLGNILGVLVADGGTDIDAGLRVAEPLLDWGRSGVTRRIVLLTDGQGGEPLKTAKSLKSRGVVLDVIGVGESPEGVDERLLRAMASVVDGELRYRFIKDQQSLVTRFTMLAGKTRVGG